jgi:hypothetical protein
MKKLKVYNIYYLDANATEIQMKTCASLPSIIPREITELLVYDIIDILRITRYKIVLI